MEKMSQLLVVGTIKHYCIFKASTQSLMYGKHAVSAEESHITPFPLALESPFLPWGGQISSQPGLIYPLTGRLEWKPELEQLTRDHQLPQ